MVEENIVMPVERVLGIQLHVLGDANEQAFCSVAYFRFSYSSGAMRCAFVTAKTRVAPKKPLIPQLELQAAVFSARLSRNMITSLTLLTFGKTAVLCFSGFMECRNVTPNSSLIELVKSWMQQNPVNGILSRIVESSR